MFLGENGKILYVGKAKDLRKRVSSYFSSNALDAKTIHLVNEIKDIEHVRVSSEIEAFLLEAVLIKKYKPFYNIKLSDDKSYPYIQIVVNGNPYVSITRKNDDDSALSFGPYTDMASLKQVLKLLRRIFPFQSVKNHPKRKCLYYHIGLCPCIPTNPDGINDYKKSLKKMAKFLMGEKENVIKDLQRDQKEYVKREEFEKAGEIQKKIDRINFITTPTYQPFSYLEKPDFYYERIKNELSSLNDVLKNYYSSLNGLTRIECYDISNIQGKFATGSMVVFVNGEEAKKEYRRFRVKTKDTPDDFQMMREVLSRRLGRDSWPEASLWVIDGGKGQVGAALQVLAARSKTIPVIGLAKREETIIVPMHKSTGGVEFEEIKLAHSTPGINLLRRIRDEAHRFAITYHRLLRKKNFLP